MKINPSSNILTFEAEDQTISDTKTSGVTKKVFNKDLIVDNPYALEPRVEI